MNILREISKRMYKVKIFLILGLSILAVYQTSQLWFVNIMSRNFFLQFFDSVFNPSAEPAVALGYSVLTSPYRIISGTGGGRFSIRYSNVKESGDKAYMNDLLAAVLERGAFSGNEAADLSVLLARPAYLYEYTFAMPAAVFADALGKSRTLFTENGVTEFDRILIQPSGTSDNTVNKSTDVYLLNGNNAAHFTLADSKFSREIAPPSEDRPHYILATGNFAAVWPDAEPQPVAVTNPYASMYGDILMSHIRSCVEPMFINPATIIENTGTDGALTYVNSDTVVRYHQRDILEYTDYRVIEDSEADFASDFAAALAFIEADSYVVNEFYLAGYELKDGQYTFRFNYVINNFPLVMPLGWPGPSENGYAIEITAEHGIVVRYKKLVYNFHIEDNENSDGAEVISYDGTEVPPPLLGYRITEDDTLELELIQLAE